MTPLHQLSTCDQRVQPATALRAPGATRLLDQVPLHTAAEQSPQLERYEIHEVLGAGGMGVVYRATDITLNRPVALKMIAPERGDPQSRRRFRMEAQTVARLRHPHVVQIYEVGDCDGRPFLALELIAGGSLSDHLATHGPMPAIEAARLVATIARAVHYAHTQGIVHRDLKPANILLEGSQEQGTVSGTGQTRAGPIETSGVSNSLFLVPCSLFPKVADFGLAKWLDADQSRTRSGAILGTPAYMAPEQARSDGRAITPAVDVYALGALLFECLTGRPPFDGEDCWEVLTQVMTADPPRPSDLRPRLSRDLDTICQKCLAKEPSRRYESAEKLAEDLERFAVGEAIAARPEPVVRRWLRQLRRRPITVASVMLLVGGLALAMGFWELRRARAAADYAHGRALLQGGDYEAACRAFDSGRSQVEGLPCCQSLANALSRAALAAELRRVTQRAIFESDPEHLSAAQQRERADECQRMWQARDQVIAQAGDDPTWEAQVRADLRDVALRSLELRRLVDPKPSPQEALRLLDELERFGAPDEVLTVERECVTCAERRRTSVRAPRSAAEAHLLGRALVQRGDYDAADVCYQAGLRLNPREEALHFDRAALAVRRGDHAVALESYSACLALRPAASTFASRGFVRIARADIARRQWEQRPYNLALLAAAVRGWKEALADFDAALALDERHATATFGRGQARLRLERPAAARADLRRALDLGYPAERGLYSLALAVVDDGESDEARELLRELLALQPTDDKARQLLDTLDRRFPPGRDELGTSHGGHTP